MKTAVKEGARQTGLLVYKDMGKTRAEFLDGHALPVKGGVLRHEVELPEKKARLGDVNDRLARVFGLSLSQLRCESQQLGP